MTQNKKNSHLVLLLEMKLEGNKLELHRHIHVGLHLSSKLIMGLQFRKWKNSHKDWRTNYWGNFRF